MRARCGPGRCRDSELVFHALALHGRQPQLLDRLLAAVVVVDGVVLLRADGRDDVGWRVQHRVDERAVLGRELRPDGEAVAAGREFVGLVEDAAFVAPGMAQAVDDDGVVARFLAGADRLDVLLRLAAGAL